MNAAPEHDRTILQWLVQAQESSRWCLVSDLLDKQWCVHTATCHQQQYQHETSTPDTTLGVPSGAAAPSDAFTHAKGALHAAYRQHTAAQDMLANSKTWVSAHGWHGMHDTKRMPAAHTHSTGSTRTLQELHWLSFCSERTSCPSATLLSSSIQQPLMIAHSPTTQIHNCCFVDNKHLKAAGTKKELPYIQRS